MQVYQTAFTAALCKQSAGLDFNEPQCTQRKQTTLIDVLYRERCEAMHCMATSFAARYQQGQLLCLGCGMDDSYNQYFHTSFSVDLPVVIEQRMLRKSFEEKGTHALISCDICECEVLWERLRQQGFDDSLPTLVILECVLAYLPCKEKVIASVCRQVHNCLLLGYDPILMTQRVVDDFSEGLAHSFGVISERPDSLAGQAWTQTLRRCGWTHVVLANMQSWNSLSCSMRIPVDVFDEFSSLCMLRQRYSVYVATMNVDFLTLGLAETHQSWLSILSRIDLAEQRVSALTRRHHFRIRRLLEKDMTAVLALYQDSFNEVADKYSVVRRFVQSSLNQLRSQWRSDEFIVAVRASEKLERVVGLVGILKPQHGRCAELCRLCVGTTEKRQGIATALMTEALAICKTQGWERVELSVHKELFAARELYHKFGFTLIESIELSSQCVDRFYKYV